MILYIHTDSLCSINFIPRHGRIGIAIECGGQCTFATELLYTFCENFLDELGIEQCNQAACTQRSYNLTFITAENRITNANTTNQSCNCPESSSDRNATANDMTMGQSQEHTTTTVYRAETTYKTDTVTGAMPTVEQPQECTPTTINRTESTNRTELATCTSSTNNQQSTAVTALAITVAILIVLLVIVTITLMWTCWTFKTKETVNRKFRQHR